MDGPAAAAAASAVPSLVPTPYDSTYFGAMPMPAAESQSRGAARESSASPTMQILSPTGKVAALSALEQVRLAKIRAVEVLESLQSESLLDGPLMEYMECVNASYDEQEAILTFPKSRAGWTPEEDKLLRLGVGIYGPNTESWPRIAMLVPGRTNKSCRKRWFHSLDPALHKGPWSAEEDSLLRQRVNQYPSQWSRVAEGIPGRTDDQCAKRWRESLDPEIDRGKWRPEEDRLLLDKYAELGTQWQKIASFFQGRPGLHCRNRWRKIQRIISQKEKKDGPITKDDLDHTLASVTESVNRRKTAQRSQAGQLRQKKAALAKASASVAASAGRGLQMEMMAEDMAVDSDGAAVPSAVPGQTACAPLRAQRKSQEIVGRPTSLRIPVEATELAHVHMLQGGMHTAPVHTAPVPLLGQVVEPIGAAALYMPSSDALVAQAKGPKTASGLHGVGSAGGGAAKRSNSVLYSPSDEQRQKLQKLGLKLYGCAANANTCSAAFADPLSLNSHLKLAHPAVASLIPSLNVGGSGINGHSDGPSDISMLSANSELATSVAGAGGSGALLKPFRCAMPGCNHAYKNVNGLEYHIFQSRKGKNHLLLEAAFNGTIDTPSPGDNIEGSQMTDEYNSSPALAAADQLQHNIDLAAAKSPHPYNCPEVECLAGFRTQHDLRQHIGAMHPRPIRRATKPSDRVYKAGHPRNHEAGSQSMSPPTVTAAGRSNTMWSSTMTLSDVLSAAGIDPTATGSPGGGQQHIQAGDVVAAAAAGLGAMPTIPEGNIPTTSAALAAVINSYVSAAAAVDTSSGAVLPHTPLHAPQMVFPGMTPTGPLPFAPNVGAAGLFAGGPADAQFMSAPALMSNTGGEPNHIGSYFSLAMDRQASQEQKQKQVSEADATASMMEAISQAAAIAAATQKPDSGDATSASPRNSAAALKAKPDGTLAQGYMLDELQLDMQMMQDMLNPYYSSSPAPGAQSSSTAAAAAAFRGLYGDNADSSGDVQMNEDMPVTAGSGNASGYTRSQRSDSIDLTSLATVPLTNSTSQSTPGNPPSLSSRGGTDTGDYSPLLPSTAPVSANNAGTKSGAHSQMAAAVMSKRQQQQQPATPWSQQDLSALGFLPLSGDTQTSSQPSTSYEVPGSRNRFTPQPADLAQFQMLQSLASGTSSAPITSVSNGTNRYQRQFASSIGGAAAMPMQRQGSNSVVRCPVPTCSQGFSDANTLKHHLGFDHTREEASLAAAGSNPGSPMDAGFFSAFPASGNMLPSSVSFHASQRQQQQNMLLHMGAATTSPMPGSAGGGDYRAKAPHWVDPETWSMWIAAANGQTESVTAAAMATAMGVTPGVAGPPTFLSQMPTQSMAPPQQPSLQGYSHYQHPTDNELLRMFDAVTNTASRSDN
ncbi:hypothetical protein LPJ53_003763 [Coemansia erecta]|uniref:Uncharacterized protein n=1 Tax=Coemansia erecta TaxID=147472 RepID=A0A9W8CSE7_9FUNG|nr:hypothetical protein LPJ53_003763 [Coemansia erecta]